MKIAKFTLLLLLLITNHLFAQIYSTKEETLPVNLEKIRSENNISESFGLIYQVNSEDSILIN